jgi:predicted amidohydrolase
MEKIKIATAQFEHRSSDKSYNLSMIKQLAGKASVQEQTLLLFTNAR